MPKVKYIYTCLQNFAIIFQAFLYVISELHKTIIFLQFYKQCIYLRYQMSHGMRLPKVWYVRPAKAQTSLRIRAD